MPARDRRAGARAAGPRRTLLWTGLAAPSGAPAVDEVIQVHGVPRPDTVVPTKPRGASRKAIGLAEPARGLLPPDRKKLQDVNN
jgi:hypothetical protein